MPITPIEQYIANALAQNFGLDLPSRSIIGIIGFMIISVFMFMLRPPTSVAFAAVGMLGIVIFGTFTNMTFGLNYSPFVFGAIIFGFSLVLYAGWKHFVAKEW